MVVIEIQNLSAMSAETFVADMTADTDIEKLLSAGTDMEILNFREQVADTVSWSMTCSNY